MNFHFQSQVAEVVGVDGAIMLENLYFWITKNQANDKHFHDGYYWTYNTQEAFSKLFPFWSRRQIQRILKNLEQGGYIKKGNYNIKGYDQTIWYTLLEPALLLIAPNSAMDCTKQCNGMHQTVQPIPYINTYNNTDNICICDDEVKKEAKEEKSNKQVKGKTKANAEVKEANEKRKSIKTKEAVSKKDIEYLWGLYPNKKEKKKSIVVIPKRIKEYGVEQMERAIKRYCSTETVKNGYIQNGYRFFNTTYLDYVDENYTESTKAEKKKKEVKSMDGKAFLESIYK